MSSVPISKAVIQYLLSGGGGSEVTDSSTVQQALWDQ